jgi:hypothetical protein
MLMRFSLITGCWVIVAGCVAPAVAPSPAENPPIVGTWQGDTFAAGAPAEVTLELFDNGTYAQRIVSKIEFGWTVDGDTLRMAPVFVTKDHVLLFGPPVKIHFVIAGDSLFIASQGESMSLRRLTPPDSALPVVGRWEGRSELSDGTTQEFTADGKMILTVTRSLGVGNYRTASGWITWDEQVPRPTQKKQRFKLKKGKLILFISSMLPPIELTRAVTDTAGA